MRFKSKSEHLWGRTQSEALNESDVVVNTPLFRFFFLLSILSLNLKSNATRCCGLLALVSHDSNSSPVTWLSLQSLATNSPPSGFPR